MNAQSSRAFVRFNKIAKIYSSSNSCSRVKAELRYLNTEGAWGGTSYTRLFFFCTLDADNVNEVKSGKNPLSKNFANSYLSSKLGNIRFAHIHCTQTKKGKRKNSKKGKSYQKNALIRGLKFNQE